MSNPTNAATGASHPSSVATDRTARALLAQVQDRLQFLRTWHPAAYRDERDASRESVGPPMPSTEQLMEDLEAVLELDEQLRAR